MYRYWMILFIVLQQCYCSEGDGCRSSVLASDTIEYLKAPGYGLSSESRQKNCYWIISTEENKRVRITIKYILKSTPSGCQTAQTDIYDGTTVDKKRQLGKWCGSEDSTFTSQGHQMLVRASGVDKIPLEVSYQSFTYRPCSRSLTITNSEVYTITSAGYPDTTERDTECSWSIKADQAFARNQTLHLTFLNVDIPETDLCGTAFVRVYAFSSTSNTRLITLCGQQVELYEFFIESLFLVYRSVLSDHTGMGFKLKVQAKDSSCSARHIAKSREHLLTSTDYPNPYPSFQRCLYHIVPGDKVMNIKMTTRTMNIASYGSHCHQEHLLVYDGQTESGRLLGKVCGNMKNEFKSLSNSMLVVFVTRDNTESPRWGFQLAYKKELCGEMIEVESEKILSFPGFLEPFTGSVECLWTVSSTARVIVHIYNLNVKCLTNKLTVYDGTINSRIMWEICDKENVMYMSSGTVMQVKLEAEGGHPTYFTLKAFKYDNQACGPNKGYLTGLRDDQTLTSPGYPYRYPDHLICIWQIQGRYPSSIVRVTINTFFEEESDVCPDYMDVFEGPVSVYNDPLFRICGTEEKMYSSKSQHVTLLFYSNEAKGGKGFSVDYISLEGEGDDEIQEQVVDTDNMAVIVGGVSGLAVFILVIFITVCVVMVVRIVRKRRANQTSRPSNLPETSTRDASAPFLLTSGTNQPSSPVPSAPPATWESTSDPPPRYQDIPAPASASPPSVEPICPPPSYEDAISKGMIHNTAV